MTLTAIVPLAVWAPSTVQRVLLAVLGFVILLVGFILMMRAGRTSCFVDDPRARAHEAFAGIVVTALGVGAISYAVFGNLLASFLGFTAGG